MWDTACILNLKKDKHRLDRLKQDLKTENLKAIKCVEGVNGYDFVPYGNQIKNSKKSKKKKLLKKMRSKLLKNNVIKNTNYRQMRIGEIGCTLSHRNTMIYALKKGYNQILILEDDARILPNFLENLEKIKDYIPKDCDLLYLGLNKINHKWGSFKKINKYVDKPLGSKKYANHPDSEGAIYGAHGYIINRKAMKEYIKHTKPMTYVSDVTLGKIATIHKKFNAYCVHKNLIDTYKFGSNTQLLK